MNTLVRRSFAVAAAAIATAGLAACGGSDSDTATPRQMTEPVLTSPDVSCRVFAAQALGRIGPSAASALPDLRDAVAVGPEAVRAAAQQAVKLIQGA